MEEEFGAASGSRKSLKTAQTRLGPPDLQGLEADELESDEDDTSSVASEQFYENIVSINIMLFFTVVQPLCIHSQISLLWCCLIFN